MELLGVTCEIMAGLARKVSKGAWTAREDRLLKRRYGSTRAAKIAARLDRPVKEVYRRARKLGLHRKHGASKPESPPAPRRRSWTETEDRLLAEQFLLLTYARLAESIGRPIDEVMQRAGELGLGKKRIACQPPTKSPRAREAYLLCRLGGMTLKAAGEKMSLTRQRLDQLVEDYSYAIAADPSLLDQLGQEYSRRYGKEFDPAELANLRPPADKAIQRRVDLLRTLDEPLDAQSVARRHPALFSAARTEYGGWDEALAGGKSPWRIAQEFIGWPDERVLQALHDRIESGGSLTASAMRQEARDLWREVRRRGGTSYYRGLAALGFDAEAWNAAHRRGWRKWTEERAERTLREWIDAGRSLHRVDVARRLPSFVTALSLAHGGWYAALAHHGVDPELWRRRGRRLPVEEISEALQRRIEAGQSLQRSAVLREDPGLLSSVRATCGGWYEALARHGFDPTPWRTKPEARRWTAEQLARALQERLDRERSLRYADVLREEPALARALSVRHGGWYAGLAHHGIDPAPWRPAATARHWTEERVAQALQVRVRRGLSLRYTDVHRQDPALVSVLNKRHGGWYAGLAHHGIDPEPWRAEAAAQRWTEERLAQALQQRIRRGQSLRYTDVKREHPSLVAVLYKRHGGWYAGLAHHGIDPQPWRAEAAARRWTEERLAQALQERIRRGLSLRYSDVHREHSTLATTLSKLHGGWYAGLAHHGIDPRPWQAVPTRRWTEERLAQALQERIRRGLSLRYSDVHREHSALAATLSKLHGGWYAGLAHHGIDPAPWQREPRASAAEQWSLSQIEEALHLRVETGRSLRPADLRKEEPGLLRAMADRHGDWYTGLAQHAVDAESWRRFRPLSAEQIRRALCRRVLRAQSLLAADVLREDGRLYHAVAAACGDWYTGLAHEGFDDPRPADRQTG